MYEQLTEEQMQDIWDQTAAGEEPPVEEAPVEQVAEDVQTEEPVAEEDKPEPETVEADPYEGLPEAVRQKLSEIDELKRLNAELNSNVKAAVGRVAAFQRHFDLAQKAAASNSGSESPTQNQMQAAMKNPAKWEALKEDFPDWAEAMEEFVNHRMSGVGKQIDPDQIAGYVNQSVSQTKAQMAQELEMAKVDMRYENWQETVKKPEFVQWVTAQPPEVQALASSTKAKDAIRMLDLFSQAVDKPVSSVKQERGARLAVAATQRGSAAPPPKTVDNMSPEELWEYEAKLRAKRKA